MIQIVKHFAFRIWTTLLFGGLLSLSIFSLWQYPSELKWLLIPFAAVFGMMFFLIGWISNRYGIHLVERLQDEAAVWERGGRPHEAEAVFKKALAVYDSFLLSPRMKRKRAPALISQMARFYLARADKNHDTEAFVLTYLKAHPQDSEFAENWLQQIGSQKLLEKKYQDIAYRIGNAQPGNIPIQQWVANLCLSARRTDFPAQRVYRRVFSAEGMATANMIRELAVIFIKEGRADEWALDIYIKALGMDKNNQQILKGIAACAHWVPPSERTTALLEQAGHLLAGISAAQLIQMRDGFMPPPSAELPQKERMTLDIFGTACSLSYRLGNRVLIFINWMAQFSIHAIRKLFGILKDSRRSRILLKWSAVGIPAAGLIVLMVNTAGYFIRTSTSDRQQKQAVAAAVTDPYTLQVAAYLKSEYAKQYVASLKKQNIDAYWTEAVGKNKRWYQVRVSHFPDKKSAIAYGEILKSKGIIKDFFVANY